MSIPDETLMAYVDGELEPSAQAVVEDALREDAEMERRVAQLCAQRIRIQAAYAAELAEPVPERLLAALRPVSRSTSNVVDLATARDAGARKGAGAPPNSRWRYATSLAASFLVAAAAGYIVWNRSQSIMIKDVAGSLVASGALAKGLSNQISGDTAKTAAVDIGLSFRNKSGDYCRTFSIDGGAAGSGLACRRATEWDIRVLTPTATAKSDNPEYRTAGSSLAPAVLAAVQDQISGDPLDRTAEIAARSQGWRSTDR